MHLLLECHLRRIKIEKLAKLEENTHVERKDILSLLSNVVHQT